MSESQEARFTEGSVASVRMGLKVITYPQQLLELANDLIKEEQRHRYSLAVIVAHIACEVAVERVVAKVTAGREIPEDQLMGGCNIGSPRNREAYTKLTGDNIQQKFFWKKFKDSTDRRNDIVHNSKVATKQEAEESLKAVGDLIDYLDRKFGTP